MRGNLKKQGISLTVLAFFAFLAVGSFDTDSDTEEVQSQQPAYSVSANQLVGEYRFNEVAADEKYKGKVIIVDGPIESIGKDIMDNAYVVLGGRGFLDGVQCTFTKGGKSSVARLYKGQTVSIKGKVAGKMGNVLINKCTLR